MLIDHLVTKRYQMGQEFLKIESNVTKRLIKCFYTCFKMRNKEM